ncbi:MAG: alpha/beta hydrolase, partial [Hyphomicrobiaceae bacterium]|nr:alpha/beta hydrolase [Hyphomicrobiaceae bacterium]
MLMAVLIGIALIVALVVFGTPVLQRRLMYFPDAERVSPASVALAGVEERVLKAPDGVEIVAWHAKPKSGQPTILYFHGNAAGLANRAER